MKIRVQIIFGLLAVAALAAAVGCQTYNFEPVAPLAIAQTTQSENVVAVALRPNIMIVVDTSGSMNKPVDPVDDTQCANSDPNCPQCGYTGCGAPLCNTAVCPTRISALQAGMQDFLTGDSGTIARFGLTELPDAGGGSCVANSQANIIDQIGNGQWASADESAPALAAHALQISTDINNFVALGGTPTASTLGALASDPPGGINAGNPYLPLTDPARQSFVLLLTDGEPNCNPNNANNCTQSACDCTLFNGISPPAGSCPGAACGCGADQTNPFCSLGCLDVDAVVSSIQALRAIKVRTIPVGYGLETLANSGVGAGFAPAALDAMALAGGFARSCPNGLDSECNPTDAGPGDLLYDTCDLTDGKQCLDGTTYCCTRKHYVALDTDTLIQALEDITNSVANTSPCVYDLQATPQNQSLLVVLINGQDIPAVATNGTVNWTYSPPSSTSNFPVVTFEGQYCTQLSNATPQSPVAVQFRIVQEL
jgi:hypothetical protein